MGKIGTVIILMVFSILLLKEVAISQELEQYSTDYFLISLPEEFYILELEPYTVLLIQTNSKCEIQPKVSITFYPENHSMYKNIQRYLDVHTKGPQWVSRVIGQVEKVITNEGREIYRFIRESIEVLNPRTLEQKEIKTYEYHILVNTKDSKGFYSIFYEVCKNEESRANEIIEKVVKSIKFLK